ncbi:hypothetical protein PR003_g24727 [Phytophthora rubi]|uniref:SGNH hydrolase-type esterase domain-containing protein n=1 Tax=Phytophthora rubi TaxID=129364 RepID=A0A6A3IT20_9STRA|nr:hypothetical protein PR002_g23943 [Phytophthora rubi]KAE8983334.1 hypothetical protein PR001_g23470 [Phytophthora rubi]KAE9292552.1 hypothetical protein PR003_g24727 [Phytophthora rubi]
MGSGAHTSIVALFVLSCFLCASVESQAVVESAKSNLRPTLLLTGDSLTELGADPAKMGWVSLSQSDYVRTADVIVRGISGYNTKWFLKYVMPTIEGEISSSAYTVPSLITIFLGTNDAALVNGSNPEMHVPISEYKENLIKIVSGFQNVAPEAGILLITPPHVDDGVRIQYASKRNDMKRGLVDRSNAVTSNYSQACVEIAGTLGIPVLNLNAHFNAMTESTLLLQDGLHFNANGNKIVHELLRSKIKTDFPTLSERLSTWQSPAASKWVAEDLGRQVQARRHESRYC